MTRYSTDPKLMAEAQARFTDRSLKRELVSQARHTQISAGRLYRFVQGAKDEDVSKALGQDLALRRTYKNMLQQQAYFHVPQALAASTQDLPDRHCDGCVIRFMASRAESDQVYLIVEVQDQRREMPHQMSVFGGQDKMEILELPPARNGVIQTIIDRTSGLADLLRDPKTEIFLR